MEGAAATVTYLLAVGTVLLALLLFVIVLSRLATGSWLPRSVAPLAKRYGLWAIAIFGALGLFLSLWYSEVVGFPPCTLCWFGRTMMYPLAVIGIVAAVRGDRSVWVYTMSLALIGMLITGYHHLYQVGFVSGDLCTAFANGGDCARRYVYEFNMVTLPLMGFVVFSATALLSWLVRAK